ncbi:hypothetical protein ACFV4T_12440 [Streptomyces sp. NPDC059755]|uniref:hypothetical protein n=1 Tax=Streptomyces sp. NPDC059755 TaxID=3346934 RepID=UPI00364702FB
MAKKSNKQSNTGMDGTDFPDDLLQTQQAWNATYRALAAPRPRKCHGAAPPSARTPSTVWPALVGAG